VRAAVYEAGIPRRIGCAGGLSERLLSERVRVPDGNRSRSWLALADQLDAPAEPTGRQFEPSADAARSAEQLLLSKGVGDDRLLVAIAPGQGFADMAVAAWSAERFAHLANRLATRHGARVILVGDPRDRGAADAMRLDLAADTLDLCGELDLATTAAVIARCDLLIAADTPLLHLAAAVGTASVGLFGPTDGRASAPAGPEHRVVQALPNGRAPASVDLIRVDDVLAGIESAL
jgi:heptosyltransferase-3